MTIVKNEIAMSFERCQTGAVDVPVGLRMETYGLITVTVPLRSQNDLAGSRKPNTDEKQDSHIL